MKYCYTVHSAPQTMEQARSLDVDGWSAAKAACVNQFHGKSSAHRPTTTARLLYGNSNLLLRFDVEDRYVISRATEFQQPVCRDSCVEFFTAPKAEKGYFNFEINCGGTLLVAYIEDPTKTPRGFAKFTLLAPEEGRRIEIIHSMPKHVPQEITQAVRWSVVCKIPFAVLERYIGAIGDLPGQIWRGNFYKCADESSHPHWASWAPIGEKLNFHQPEFFGELRFG